MIPVDRFQLPGHSSTFLSLLLCRSTSEDYYFFFWNIAYKSPKLAWTNTVVVLFYSYSFNIQSVGTLSLDIQLSYD